MIRPSLWKSLNVRVPFATSTLLLVAIGLAAVVLGTLQYEDLKTLLGKAQMSTATVLTQEMEHELGERFQALHSLAGTITRDMITSPASAQTQFDGQPVVYVLFNAGVFVVDQKGVAVASVPASLGRVGTNYLVRSNVRLALTEGLSTLSEIAIGLAVKKPVVSMAVPIKDADGKIIGALVGVIDLTSPNFFDQMGRSAWAEEGGFLLVSTTQRLIVTASDKSRIMELLPPEGKDPGLDSFLRGAEGTRIFVNPHGLEVLASVRQIPQNGWFIAVYDSTKEAFAPLNQQSSRLLMVAIVLTLLVGLLNWFLVRRQLRPVLRTLDVLAQAGSTGLSTDLIPVTRKDEVGALILSFNKLLAERERQAVAKAQYEKMVGQNQRIEALGVLAGGISHDFNNLLSGIYGNIELALLRTQDQQTSNYLRKTLDTLGRARDLSKQLMTFSRGGQPELKTQKLFPFVEECVRFGLSGSNVRVTFTVDPALWTCAYDASRIGQAIENLVINAVQAMPGGGTLQIGAGNLFRPDGSRWVRLSFTDSGVGMTPETLSHLFEPFFTTKAEGHGLGLTMCQSIVNQHGGTMNVESHPGRGTTFVIELPEGGAAADPSPDTIPEASTPGAPGGTILIMDDDPVVAEVLETLLVQLGFHVQRTLDGTSALEAFVADSAGPKLLVAAILDLTIPGGPGGLETLVNIRKLDATFPVIVASGYSDAAILANPLAYGFNGAVRKPYLRQDLSEVLFRVLRTPPEHGILAP